MGLGFDKIYQMDRERMEALSNTAPKSPAKSSKEDSKKKVKKK